MRWLGGGVGGGCVIPGLMGLEGKEGLAGDGECRGYEVDMLAVTAGEGKVSEGAETMEVDAIVHLGKWGIGVLYSCC